MLAACFHFVCRAVQCMADSGDVSPLAGHCSVENFECFSTFIQFRCRAQDINSFRVELLYRLRDCIVLCGEFRRWRVDSLWGTGHKRCFWSRVSKKTQDINSFRVEWWHGEQDNSLFRTELRRSA